MMYWRKEMDLQDLAIELFCRFDPDHKGYITQDQLLNSSVKDNVFSEGQIISVFALLDKDEKGIITLSDFTDAFVDVSVSKNDSELLQEGIGIVDGRYVVPTFSNSNEKIQHDNDIDRFNRIVNGSSSTEKCECPCNKNQQCTSNLKVKCCKYDRTLKPCMSSEFLNDILNNDITCSTRQTKRHFGFRKSSLARRESSPTLVMGKRAEAHKSNLLKSKRWKSYDYGINRSCITLNEEIEEMNKSSEITNGTFCNGIDNKYECALLSEQTMLSRLSLGIRNEYYSETTTNRENNNVTKELDEIFGTNENISKTGCKRCNLNRKLSTTDSNSCGRPNHFSDNVFTDSESSRHYKYRNSLKSENENVKRKLCYDNDDKYQNSGILQNSNLYSANKKNGYLSAKKEIIISNQNGDDTDNHRREALLEEEWGSYLRRIGGVSLFSGNHTLQYLWQQIKLYQSDLVFPFDKFLKSVIEEQKSIYSKCQETENTLHLKIEQHEKEINNLYEEFDIAREKEVKQHEKKQYEREEYLKAEFRKIIDYKEQAYQECCKHMAHISERLENYEEEMTSLQSMKRKAEEQCKYLLQEQQRYLLENRHMIHENEILKQKYKACKNSISDMQDHLNQLKDAAEEEKEKHRSFMLQYNDIVDEKSFLETSLANLSMENVELRNIKRSHVTLEDKILPSIPSIELTDLTDFPICTSSPVKQRLLNHLDNSYHVMSLHEELNSSYTENNNSISQKSPDEKMNEHSETSKVCEISSTNTESKQSDNKCDVRDSIAAECFNITHHFIACDKLSISKNLEDSDIIQKSLLTGSDPLIKFDDTELKKKKIESSIQDKSIHLAAPFKSEFKIIFCGDSNVGKTSLIYRICFGVYRGSLRVETTAVDTFVKNVETGGQNFKLKIWDTAGQERFNSIPHSYYRKSDVAIIMYDVTNEISFLNLKSWLDNVQKYSDDVLLIILGNKIDLNDTRTVLKQSGEKFAKENDAVFIETSAKSGENIERLLYLLTTKLLDQNEFVLIQNYFEQSCISESSTSTKRSCCN